jgi:adenosine deaminase
MRYIMDRKRLFSKMKDFPKVDLHRHLEGSILPETLLKIAKKHGGVLPAYELDQLRPLVQMIYDPPGFNNFLDKFKVFRGFYPGRHAIEEVAYTAVKEAAEDNVKYLELRYSPSHFACSGRFRESDVIEWIQGAIERACREFDIIVIPLLTISRDYGVDLATSTVELATKMPPGFFYGLDIAGNEIENSAKPFSELFDMAKRSGFGLTIHAGEACGATNVREAVIHFNADRVGHGIRSVEDETVIELLRKKKRMLEVCLSSNLHTGAIPSIKSHPVRKLMEYGVPVSLNTDDPAISAITLTGEYVLAVTELGFNEDDLKALNRAALEHAFYPDKEKLKEKLSYYWD